MKDSRVTMRIEKEQLSQLNFFCKKHNTDKSKIITELVAIFNQSEEFRDFCIKHLATNKFDVIKVKRNEQQQKEYDRKRQREYRNKSKINKMKANLRTRTYLAFKKKRYNKNSSTEKMLGASYEIVKQHLQNQFTEGMSWDNYGEWHIDHIIPLASAKTEKELIKLSYYTNLQPLWAKENISKGSKMPSELTRDNKFRKTITDYK